MRHFLFHYLVVPGNVWELTLTDILCLLLSFPIYNHHVSIGGLSFHFLQMKCYYKFWVLIIPWPSYLIWFLFDSLNVKFHLRGKYQHSICSVHLMLKECEVLIPEVGVYSDNCNGIFLCVKNAGVICVFKLECMQQVPSF